MAGSASGTRMPAPNSRILKPWSSPSLAVPLTIMDRYLPMLCPMTGPRWVLVFSSFMNEPFCSCWFFVSIICELNHTFKIKLNIAIPASTHNLISLSSFPRAMNISIHKRKITSSSALAMTNSSLAVANSLKTRSRIWEMWKSQPALMPIEVFSTPNSWCKFLVVVQ